MKQKKTVIAAIVAVAVVAVVVATQSSNWSTLSYEAVVQETVFMQDGEIRLIVKRTTNIHASPLNSLRMAGIPLRGLNVTMIELQLIGGA